MSEIKVLCLVLIFAYISNTINSLGVYINLSGKSKPKTFQDMCVSDADCGYGLKCITFKCRCPNDEYWNSTNCETKLVLYFKTTNYSTITVNQYNGGFFGFVSNVAVVEKPSYFIYASDSGNVFGVLAKYDQFGSYINHIPLTGVYGLQPINNSMIYVSRFSSSTFYIYDLNLNLTNSKEPANETYVSSPRYLRYNPSNGLFYVTDSYTQYVNALDSEYNLIESECFQLNDGSFGIGFYQSSTLGNLILVTTFSNTIEIVLQSNKTVHQTLSSVCNSSFPLYVFVHQKTGYILVSCNEDNLIQLWFTDGLNFVYTGIHYL